MVEMNLRNYKKTSANHYERKQTGRCFGLQISWINFHKGWQINNRVLNQGSVNSSNPTQELARLAF